VRSHHLAYLNRGRSGSSRCPEDEQIMSGAQFSQFHQPVRRSQVVHWHGGSLSKRQMIRYPGQFAGRDGYLFGQGPARCKSKDAIARHESGDLGADLIYDPSKLCPGYEWQRVLRLILAGDLQLLDEADPSCLHPDAHSIRSHIGTRCLLDAKRLHRRIFADKQSSHVSSIRVRQPSNAQYISVLKATPPAVTPRAMCGG